LKTQTITGGYMLQVTGTPGRRFQLAVFAVSSVTHGYSDKRLTGTAELGDELYVGEFPDPQPSLGRPDTRRAVSVACADLEELRLAVTEAVSSHLTAFNDPDAVDQHVNHAVESIMAAVTDPTSHDKCDCGYCGLFADGAMIVLGYGTPRN
jgi:hypothetical protein